MKKIRILKNWAGEISYLSPQGDGSWGDYLFTEDELESPDGLLILNGVSRPEQVTTPEGRAFTHLLEPPTRFHRYLARASNQAPIFVGPEGFRRENECLEVNCPMIPWHIGLSYADLNSSDPFENKTRDLSTITSRTAVLPEHRRRVAFLERVSRNLKFDWFGRGVKPISKKYEGLLPYRYTIVYENYIGADYWSEKLADAFLAGCLPIYVGCTNLEDYFPVEAFVRIDPSQQHVDRRISEICRSDIAEKNRDALLEARSRVLNDFNLLKFYSDRFDQEPLGGRRIRVDLTPPQERNVLRRAEGWIRWKIGNV